MCLIVLIHITAILHVTAFYIVTTYEAAPRWPIFLSVKVNDSVPRDYTWSFRPLYFPGSFSPSTTPNTTSFRKREVVTMMPSEGALRKFEPQRSVQGVFQTMREGRNAWSSPHCIGKFGVRQRPCIGRTVVKSFFKEGRYEAIVIGVDRNGNFKRASTELLVRNRDRYPKVMRKEFRNVTFSEWKKFVDGLWVLKESGFYDMLVDIHLHAMLQVYSSSIPDLNAAHGGPAFCPWHRLFTRVVEISIQHVLNDPSFFLPYWNWTIDMSLPGGPRSSPLWTPQYIGSNGDFWTMVVQDGPFCSNYSSTCLKPWQLPKDHDGPFLKRQLGYSIPVLPTTTTIDFIMNQTVYDSPPYSNISEGFRAVLEGWGALGHNSVHRFIGGQMASVLSPADPAFWLHHSFTDKLWLIWQRKTQCYQGCFKPDDRDFERREDVPGAVFDKQGKIRLPGHHWSDRLYPWDVRIKDVSDEWNSGDGYDFE